MREWKVYRTNQSISAQTQVEKLIGEKVPDGFILEVMGLEITNITAHDDNLELGYVDAGGEDRVISINNGAAVHTHHIEGEIFLMAGEQPYGRITTAAANDKCHFSCHGKLWPVD